MKKRRSRRNDGPSNKARKIDSGPVYMHHPFSGVDPKIVRAALAQMGAKKAEKFPQEIADLLAILRSKYPLHILAVLASYGLQATASDEGVSDNSLIPRINQHHIELLQALVLTIPRDEWNNDPADPSDIQRVIDILVELADGFHQRRFAAIEQERNLQERMVLALQERLRLHTQVVRNWGYFSDVVKISGELYAPLDAELKKAVGFTASELIAIARGLTVALEERANARFRLLQRIFRERKINRLVRRYYKEYPDIEGDPEEFIRFIPNGATREAVIARLLSHADIGLVPMLVVRPTALAAQLQLPINVVTNVLNALSLDADSLRGQDIEAFFLNNPVWPSPIMRLDKEFFCPMPQAIFSHIHDVMRSLIESAGLKATLDQRRAAYLEQKVEALLAFALPNAQRRHRVKWRDQNVEYETDHVAVLDKTVVIVEDKSAALTAPALRGAPDRVKRHVRDLVFAPSEQSARLEAMIERARAGDTRAATMLAPFGLDFTQVEQVIRISVTLDDFSVICSAEKELHETGWIAGGLKLATTINVADFQAVIDILERPSFIVHYFAERQRIQNAMQLVADEMDFLGMYLQTGFDIWGIESESAFVALTGMSQAVDRYYQSRDAGIALAKPAPKLHPYFARLIRAVEERAFPHWLTVTTHLLRTIGFDEQKKLDRMLTKLRSNVEKNWRDHDHECSVVVTPPEIRDTALVFYAFPEKLAAKRKETAQIIATKALEESGRKRCILISRNIDRWSDPYSSILITNAPAP